MQITLPTCKLRCLRANSRLSALLCTHLHVYLGYVWVVIYVNYITYEGILHNTLALDVDTAQSPRVYNKLVLNLTYEKALWIVWEPVQAERGVSL